MSKAACKAELCLIAASKVAEKNSDAATGDLREPPGQRVYSDAQYEAMAEASDAYQKRMIEITQT